MTPSFAQWLLVATAATLAGCANAPSNLDAHFGEAVLTARAAQTMNPDASRNQDPARGLDGISAREAIGRYQDSFKAPPPTFNVINIGGGISGGGQ